jgi:hypothetical protein
VLFDEPDGVFVERRSADAHAWWSSEPIEDARPRFTAPAAARAVRVNDERVLVPALVAGEPQMRQNYFLF